MTVPSFLGTPTSPPRDKSRVLGQQFLQDIRCRTDSNPGAIWALYAMSCAHYRLAAQRSPA
jgi:hypothetical protein